VASRAKNRAASRGVGGVMSEGARIVGPLLQSSSCSQMGEIMRLFLRIVHILLDFSTWKGSGECYYCSEASLAGNCALHACGTF
jgi:hypothetical protein